METRRLPLDVLEQNTGQIEGLPSNPRQWTKEDVEQIAASLKETPELFEARPIIVYPLGEKYIILGGNLRYEGSKKNKEKEVPCFIVPEGTAIDKLKEIVIKDNGSFGAWDYDALGNEWDDLPLTDWGVPAWNVEAEEEAEETEEEEYERRKREFEERMAAGEISEEDEEYQEFLQKFELKKTTDDCYTPAPVYDAVARYVEETYGVSKAKFIRPFYPGGDYENENYPKGCVVVDNPPFSILAQILQFYEKKRIKFFLFAPTLTLFSSSCCCLPTGVSVIYENGAAVNTSFITNLEPESIRIKSTPKLYAMVEEGVKEFTKTIRKSLPKYSYPPYVVTSPFVGALSRLGIEFCVPRAESVKIGALDAQREAGKGIYGSGYLVSDRVVAEREKAEREKAEREKAEREKAERWALSDREIKIIKELNKA